MEISSRQAKNWELRSNDMEDKWVNTEELAEYLSITMDTARTWIKAGMLPAYKAGRRYKFKLSEVDEWVRDGKIKGIEEDGSED